MEILAFEEVLSNKKILSNKNIGNICNVIGKYKDKTTNGSLDKGKQVFVLAQEKTTMEVPQVL